MLLKKLKIVRMMFTKRVDRWLQATFPDVRFDKPRVMKQVIELAELPEVNLEPFRMLVKSISTLLANLP
jgi:hypothetical protein